MTLMLSVSQVDYRERAAAMGRIPQNFFRRELRPKDSETIISRLIGEQSLHQKDE